MNCKCGAPIIIMFLRFRFYGSEKTLMAHYECQECKTTYEWEVLKPY